MLISGFGCYIQSYLRDALGYSLLMLTYIHDFDQGHKIPVVFFFYEGSWSAVSTFCMKETHNLHLLLLKCLVKWTCSIGSFTNMILSFENADIYITLVQIFPEWGFSNNHELFNTCVWTEMLIYKHLFSASVSLVCSWH